MYQIFAETDKAFERLRRAKTYRMLCIIYAIIGVLLIALLTVQMNLCFVICGLVGLSTAGFYFRRSNMINAEVLDLAECNICLSEDMISGHQAAKGKYETFNIYYEEIESIAIKKRTPGYYIIMQDKPDLESSYYIDGQQVETFGVIDVDGSDYDLKDFRESVQTLIDDPHVSAIRFENKENTSSWKVRKEICDKIVPLLVMAVLAAAYYALKFILGGAL